MESKNGIFAAGFEPHNGTDGHFTRFKEMLVVL
jgi:hypothetical protein